MGGHALATRYVLVLFSTTKLLDYPKYFPQKHHDELLLLSSAYGEALLHVNCNALPFPS
jgi:hypothetical protein